jgi:hypothetical protein
MDVSVIVLNYNGRDLTPECLASIPPGVQTIVVDNGSTDGSPAEIESRFPWVKMVRNPVNRGFAAGVNQGIERSSCGTLCLLNNDARLMPRSLETMVEFMAENPDVGILAPQLLHEDGRRQHSFAPLPSLATECLNKSLMRFLFPGDFPHKKSLYVDPFDVPSVIGACMMIRRPVVDRIGGLDPAYFLFLEETDYCLRARRAGFRVVFLPWANVIHLQGRTRDKAAVAARVEYARSLFTFFRKQRPLSYPFLRAFYPVKNLVELATLGLAAPFSRRARSRWVETAALLAWQAAGCPRTWGLSTAADPRYVPVAIPGGRLIVAEGDVETFRAFDTLVSSRRVVKDFRHKRTEEVRLGYRTFLVKTYKAGPWPRRLKTALFGSRGIHELKMSDAVLRLGLPTAPVAAAGERGGESWVAVEIIPGADQLQEVLLSRSTSTARRRELLLAYGKFARRLHDAGVSQYDFNPSNILLDGSGFRVIDFEKMRIYGRPVPERVRMKALAKMNRVPELSRTDRLRFLKGYLEAHIVDRLRRKQIAARVRRLWRAQEARDAGRAERRCVSENRDFAAFDFGEVSGYYRRTREDHPEAGITPEDLRRAAEAPEGQAPFRLQESGDAIAEWKRANRESREGKAFPLAVLVRKGGRRGSVVFPK